jgi:hypothetical protein
VFRLAAWEVFRTDFFRLSAFFWFYRGGDVIATASSAERILKGLGTMVYLLT